MDWSSDVKTNEKERLDTVARWFALGTGMYANTTRWTATEVLRMARGTSCLELGTADGDMTPILEERFERLVAVDASEEYVLATRAKVSSKTRVIQAFFEELEFDETFDTIVMGHILEHILDPVALLARAQQWLSPNSAILVIVPNAWSLHRLAAVEMGLLASPEQLNETDHRLGHRRVYTPETLRADIEKAGLVVGQTGGIFLKVLSNSQLENQWSPEMIEAYYKLGFRFPEYGAEIYAECLLP